ncbi:putative Wd40 repeat, subgroup [Candidatus Terasakiella magnetica]|nr:putative Wd40 repeat, subgroup [Candidatus Terasakiella magnetica]
MRRLSTLAVAVAGGLLLIPVGPSQVQASCCGGGSYSPPPPAPVFMPPVMNIPTTSVGASGGGSGGSSGGGQQKPKSSVSAAGLVKFPDITFQSSSLLPASSVSTAGNNDEIVVGLSNGDVSFWSLRQGREMWRRPAHSGKVQASAMSSAAQVAVTVGADAALRVWSLKGAAAGASIALADGGKAVAISPDGTRAVVGLRNGSVQVIPLAGGVPVMTVPGTTEVSSITVSSDQSRAAAGDAGGELRLIGLNDGSVLTAKVSKVGLVSSVFMAGGKIAALDRDGAVYIVTAQGAAEKVEREDAKASVLGIDDSGATLAIGQQDGGIQIIDTASMEPKALLRWPETVITGISFGRDGKLIYALGDNGAMRVFRRDDASDVGMFLVSKDGWAVVNQQGQFDGESDGPDAVRLAAGDRQFNLEQFSEPLFEPGLLGRSAVGTPPPPPPVSAGVEFKLPPLTKIALGGPTTVEAETMAVSVSVTDQGGGISEVRLYQNGKLVASSPVAAGAKEFNQSFTVTLAEGQNQLAARALSSQQIESDAASTLVVRTGSGIPGTLRVITVGINQYSDPNLNLDYGVPDAESIAAYFGGQVMPLVKEARQIPLRDVGATRAAVLAKLSELGDTRPEDTVVLYLAGHGVVVDDKWYFIPTDVPSPMRKADVPRIGISAAEIADGLMHAKAQKIMLLLDACHSGAAVGDSSLFEDRKKLVQMARTFGLHVIAAAEKEQKAAELPELGHGAFTYTVLQGLEGRADTIQADGRVTVDELTSYVKRVLPDISLKYAGEAQIPVVYGRGVSFAVFSSSEFQARKAAPATQPSKTPAAKTKAKGA